MTTEIAIPDNVPKAVGTLAQRFSDKREELFELIEKLKERDITPMTVQLAVEADTSAKAFAEEVTRAFEPTVTVLFNTHRAATGVRAKILEPVKTLRDICTSIVSQYRLAQARKEKEAESPAERAEIKQQIAATLPGVSTTQGWEATVEDLPKLIKHIGDHPELAFLLEVREGDLKRYVNRMEGKVELPGVKIEETFGKRNRNSDA